jgi:hypothetical protein
MANDADIANDFSSMFLQPQTRILAAIVNSFVSAAVSLAFVESKKKVKGPIPCYNCKTDCELKQ